jgi:hypothetical protein
VGNPKWPTVTALQGGDLHAAVAAVTGAVQDRDAVPGQGGAAAPSRVGWLALTATREWACVRVTRNSAASGWVSQRVGGDHHAGQVQARQQWLEGGDLLWRAADLRLGPHRAGGVVGRGQQVHGAAVAVCCGGWCGRAPRSVVPSTATACRRRRCPRRSWRSRSHSQAPSAAAMAWVSSRPRVRRMVVLVGTMKWPVSRSRRVPSAARTGWGAAAAHSAIAVIDRAPVSTAAAASPTMATSGWRRPARARGSGMAAR